jgi:hypothetical protein
LWQLEMVSKDDKNLIWMISSLITLYIGVDGTEIRVDVGECRELCNNLNQKKNLKREEFDKYLKKYPNLDPLQVCNYANFE